MLQTKPSVHPGAKHIQSLHELGPGDPCLSLVCSSRVIWSAMAFFFVATYTKSISNFLISAISNASLTQIISHTPHWALWYNPVSRTDDKFNEWGPNSWVKCICNKTKRWLYNKKMTHPATVSENNPVIIYLSLVTNSLSKTQEPYCQKLVKFWMHKMKLPKFVAHGVAEKPSTSTCTDFKFICNFEPWLNTIHALWLIIDLTRY